VSNAVKLIKSLLPPIVVEVLKRTRRAAVEYSGDFASWEEASAVGAGYDAEAILDKVIRATRQVTSGERTYERDSVTFDTIEYSWPLLASLLQAALECGSLRVIDFGGALGSTWRQNFRYLGRLRLPTSWSVVEQEHFVTAGRKEFTTDVLSFHDSIGMAARGGVDVALFASSLCYVADPEAVLNEIALTDARFLLLDRHPTVAGVRDRIVLQRVREPIYNASYPVRISGIDRLLGQTLRSWRLIEQWDCDLQPAPWATHRGFFLERR
jgi:putative methyltransferase (TIGR04325 family)